MREIGCESTYIRGCDNDLVEKIFIQVDPIVMPLMYHVTAWVSDHSQTYWWVVIPFESYVGRAHAPKFWCRDAIDGDVVRENVFCVILALNTVSLNRQLTLTFHLSDVEPSAELCYTTLFADRGMLDERLPTGVVHRKRSAIVPFEGAVSTIYRKTNQEILLSYLGTAPRVLVSCVWILWIRSGIEQQQRPATVSDITTDRETSS